ncbi:MAG: RNA polymerase sigma factor, partial [Planctomycetota bacterium]
RASKTDRATHLNSDANLVTQTLKGQKEAYDTLVRRWSARVLAVCVGRTGRRDVAEELAQETLVRGYVALRSLGDPSKFGNWIASIAHRVSIDWVRGRRRAVASFSEVSPSGLAEQADPVGGTASDALERDDEIEELLHDVAQLPATYRETLLLFYYGEHSYKELAELLGVSQATVNARLTKARSLLRQRARGRENRN